eukprot:TRINITY_DN10679_c0_g1_i1.p1 TRINITY_DN10679_c0_g1~~TRINITY_DN10679_c0_g1_i1.p1  ORF type:complete len:394 (-),score=88.37 TRINITY_DN10679_c0_g1_i1:181-1362(-)
MRVPCHKTVLMTISSELGEFVEASNPKYCELSESFATVQQFVRFLYTGEVHADFVVALELISLGKKFNIRSLYFELFSRGRILCRFTSSIEMTLFALYHLGLEPYDDNRKEYPYCDGKSMLGQVWSCIQLQFLHLRPIFVKYFEIQVIEQLVKDECISHDSEGDILHFVLAWINHDRKNREIHRNKLLQFVKFEYLPKSVFASFIQSKEYDLEIQEIILEQRGQPNDIRSSPWKHQEFQFQFPASLYLEPGEYFSPVFVRYGFRWRIGVEITHCKEKSCRTCKKNPSRLVVSGFLENFDKRALFDITFTLSMGANGSWLQDSGRVGEFTVNNVVFCQPSHLAKLAGFYCQVSEEQWQKPEDLPRLRIKCRIDNLVPRHFKFVNPLGDYGLIAP